ncbi:MAG: hypothetical protein ABIS18_09290, partial [Actinomycetota bacterium]
MKKVLWIFALVMFVSSGCGKSNDVGGDLKIPVGVDPSECARLGQKCPPSPSVAPSGAGAIGAKPSVSPPPPAPPPEEKPAITVIIPEGQNYEPASVELVAGAILEVINKDCRPEIPKGRTYTATDGTFDSGYLACGKVFRWKAN